jgi:hypothetical protein
MPKYTTDDLPRLNHLLALPDDAVVNTKDARLLAGGLSPSDWQRRRKRGETPERFWLTRNAHGFRVGACKAMARRTELPEPEDAEVDAA